MVTDCEAEEDQKLKLNRKFKIQASGMSAYRVREHNNTSKTEKIITFFFSGLCGPLSSVRYARYLYCRAPPKCIYRRAGPYIVPACATEPTIAALFLQRVKPAPLLSAQQLAAPINSHVICREISPASCTRQPALYTVVPLLNRRYVPGTCRGTTITGDRSK